MKVCNSYWALRGLFTVAILLLTMPAYSAKESWYTYWALGASTHSYDADIQAFKDFAQNQPGSFSNIEVASDLWGFYWPWGDSTIAGVVVSSTSDNIYKLDLNEPNNLAEFYTGFPYISGASEYVSIRQHLMAASIMHFYGDEIGSGFYVRGDAGIAILRIESDIASPVVKDEGIGVLAGIGYGLPLSEDTRLLFGLSFKYNKIGGRDYRSTVFTIGGLW